MYAGHEYCFGITAIDNQRQYILEADNPSHRMEWIDALKPLVKRALKAQQNSIKEGFLTKRGGIMKNWKRRFCILTVDSLNYYEELAEISTPTGTVDLSASFTYSVEPLNTHGVDRPYVFTITPYNNKRTYYFVTQTEQERDEWIEKLKEVLEKQKQQK